MSTQSRSAAFFALGHPRDPKERYYGHVEGRRDGQAFSWDDLQNIRCGMLDPTEKLECVVPKGLPSAKVLLWMSVTLPVLTEEAAKIWLQAKLTGWKAIPVDLVDPQKRLIGAGFAISVTGRCGPTVVQSGHRKKIGVMDYDHGLTFDNKSWDGSDIFCETGKRASIYTTERVKELSQSAGIDALFIPFHEVPTIVST